MSWRVTLSGRVGALNVALRVAESARVVAVVGPNGAGKSTLLRAIAGAAGGLTGRVEVDGAVLLDTAAGVDLPAEQRGVGYVPQGYGLFPHLSARQNVGFGASPAATEAALVDFEIAHLAERRPHRLSGGEQQRVALARALAAEPRALLLDEPLAALDVAGRRRARQILVQRLRQSPRPTLLVTHDLRDLRAFDPMVLVLEAGRVVQRGDWQALAAAPVNDFVAELTDLGG